MSEGYPGDGEQYETQDPVERILSQMSAIYDTAYGAEADYDATELLCISSQDQDGDWHVQGVCMVPGLNGQGKVEYLPGTVYVYGGQEQGFELAADNTIWYWTEAGQPSVRGDENAFEEMLQELEIFHMFQVNHPSLVSIGWPERVRR